MQRIRGGSSAFHGAGGDGADDLFGGGEPEDQARDQRPRARQRARMDRSRMDGICSSHRPRSIPVPRLRRSRAGPSEVQVGFRHRAGRRTRQQHTERARSESRAVHQPRRQADSVHGWSDPQISPFGTTQYYERVAHTLGGRDKVHGSYRLYMAPGMGHCSGGEGPNTFDMVAAIERWVEAGGGAESDTCNDHAAVASDQSLAAVVPIPGSCRLQRNRKYR